MLKKTTSADRKAARTLLGVIPPPTKQVHRHQAPARMRSRMTTVSRMRIEDFGDADGAINIDFDEQANEEEADGDGEKAILQDDEDNEDLQRLERNPSQLNKARAREV